MPKYKVSVQSVVYYNNNFIIEANSPSDVQRLVREVLDNDESLIDKVREYGPESSELNVLDAVPATKDDLDALHKIELDLPDDCCSAL